MAQLTKVKEFLRVSKFDEQYLAMLKLLRRQQASYESKGEVLIADALNDHIREEAGNYRKIAEAMAQVLADAFTDAEVDELIEMYTSPVYQKLLDPVIIGRMADCIMGGSEAADEAENIPSTKN